MVAHNLPYVATVNPSYPFDLFEKINKAASIEGPAYIHAYAACPTGWRMRPELAVQIGRLAVESGVFPLYEVEHGRYRITVPTPELRPLRDYLKPQGRFRHLTPDLVEEVEARIHQEYRRLEAKVRMSGEEEA
jgi:pyruvate ferredoxin oxidoreductase beta subunit